MNSYLEGYEEWRGDFPTRYSGSIVADRPGNAVAYALFNLEPAAPCSWSPAIRSTRA